MTITKRFGAALAATLLAGVAQAAAAQTTTFSFSFTAPLTNGDTASGSGTLTTEKEKDVYRVTGATGSFVNYQGSSTSYTIIGASTYTPGFFTIPEDATLFVNEDGVLQTNSIQFIGTGAAIGFTLGDGGRYDGGEGIEVAVRDATLTFAPLDAPAVPEPASWALMIAGFGALGVAARRRPRVGVAYA